MSNASPLAETAGAERSPMIKMVYAWKDRRELGAEACEAHWRQNHAALAERAYMGAAGFRGLVYNRVRRFSVNDQNSRESRPVEPDFDAYIDLYFEDEESLEAAFAQPAMEEMFQDHSNFMETDGPRNVLILEVDETVVLGRPD